MGMGSGAIHSPTLMFIITSILLVLSSVLFWPFSVNDPFLVIKESVFVLGSLSLFAYSFYRGNCINHFRNTFLALILIYIVLGFIWFFYVPFITAKGKVLWNFWNFRPTINVICSMLLIKLLFENCYSFKNWINLGKVIAWVGGVLAVYSILQYFNIEPVFNLFNKNFKYLFENGTPSGDQRMVTLFGSSFVTSAFLAVCAPMCLIYKNMKYRIFYILIFISLILLNKTMALGALIISLAYYLLINKKMLKFKILISGCLLFLIYKYFKNPDFFSFMGRESVWISTWNKFLESPLFGFGLGYFEMLKLKSNNLDVFFAHNEYLQNLVDLGIVGSLIIFMFFVDLSKKIFRSDQNILLVGYTCGLISLLVLSFGSFPIRIAPIALIAIIYIAGLLYQCKGAVNE